MRVWFLLLVTTSLGYNVDDIGEVFRDPYIHFKSCVNSTLAGLGDIPSVDNIRDIVNTFVETLFDSGRFRNFRSKVIEDGIRQISAQLTELVAKMINTYMDEVKEIAKELMEKFMDIVEENDINSTRKAIDVFLAECENKKLYEAINTMNFHWRDDLFMAQNNNLYPSRKKVNTARIWMANVLTQLTFVYLAQQHLIEDQEDEVVFVPANFARDNLLKERNVKIGKLTRKFETLREEEDKYLKRMPEYNRYGMKELMKEIIETAMTNQKYGHQRVKADVMGEFMSDVFMPSNGLICALTGSHNISIREEQEDRVTSYSGYTYFNYQYGIITIWSPRGSDRYNVTTLLTVFHKLLEDERIRCFPEGMESLRKIAKENRLIIISKQQGFAQDSIFECQGTGTIVTTRAECTYGKDQKAYADYIIIPV